MIQGQVFGMSSQEFMEIINIPRFAADTEKIHLLPHLTDKEFATLLDPEVTGDYMPPTILPKHLIFIAKTWFFILSKTLMPITNASEESAIPPGMRRAIHHLSHGMVFDFEDCFLRTMAGAAQVPFAFKPYAPWIQAVCNFGRAKEFFARHHPKLFTPPVRNTLDILRQPNNPFSTYVGLRQEVNDR